MAGERVLSIRIIGDAKGGTKALAEVDAASAKTTANQKVLSGALTDVKNKLLGVVPGGQQVDSALQKVAASSTGAGLSMSGALVGGVAAAGVAIAGLTAQGVGKFASLTAEVTKFKNATGASAAESSKMVAIAHGLGVDTDALSGSLFKSGAAIEHNAKQFEDLGIRIAHNRDGTVDLVGTLENAAKAYQATTDATTKDAIAKELGGKRGQELIPILKADAAAIKEFGDAAAKRGEVFTSQDLQAGIEYRQSIRELGQSGGALEISLARGVVPALTDTANSLAKVTDDLNKMTAAIGGVAGAYHVIRDIVNPAQGAGDALDWLGSKFHFSTEEADKMLNRIPFVNVGHKEAADAANTQADALAGLTEQEAAAVEAVDNFLDKVPFLTEEHNKAAAAAIAQAAAEKGVTDALTGGISAIQGLEQADQQVTDTQKALTDAQNGYAKKARDVTDANNAIQKTTLDVKDAEQAVTDARRAAPRDLAKAKQDEAAGVHQIADATAELAVAVAKYGAESRQAADAADKLASAKSSHADATDKLNDLERDPNRAVEAAEQRLTDAKQAQLDAQQKLNDAKKEDPAADIAKAEQAAKDAVVNRELSYEKMLTIAGALNTALGITVDLTDTSASNLASIVDKILQALQTAASPEGFGKFVPGPGAAGSYKGPRAAGGPVSAGDYLIGEKGPELLHLGPGASGNVTSNAALTTHNTPTINILVPPGTDSTLTQRIGQEMAWFYAARGQN